MKTDEYKVYWYPGDVQRKGRRRVGEYLSFLGDPEKGAGACLEESTMMMLERMSAKASQIMGGHLYRRMAIGEWAPARTVIALRTLLSTPKDEHDAKGITRLELYNRALTEINEMVSQVGRTAFLLTPEQVYSEGYLRNKILKEVIEGLKAPKLIPHLYENSDLLTRPSISPVNLTMDLLGSPYYAYPAGKVGFQRAMTLAEIAMVPYIEKNFVVEKIQFLRGLGDEYKKTTFEKTLEVHGPLGSGYIREALGGLVRTIDVKLIREVDIDGLNRKSTVPLSDTTIDALRYISEMGIVPKQTIYYIFGLSVVQEIQSAINADLRFFIRELGPAYVTRRRIVVLNLRESDPLLLVVLSNLMELWRRVLPWIWGSKERTASIAERSSGKLDFLETISTETYQITHVLKELYDKGTYYARNPIERTIIGYLREKGLVTTPVLGPEDSCAVIDSQHGYLEYMTRLSGGIV